MSETLISFPGTDGNLPASSPYLTEPAWVRRTLIGTALLFLAFFLLLPLAVVLGEAFAKGAAYYLQAIQDPLALSALRLTLLAAFFSVLFNTLFGLSAAWAVTRSEEHTSELQSLAYLV